VLNFSEIEKKMQKEPEILPIKRFSLKIVEPEFIHKHLYKKMCDFSKKQKNISIV